MKKTMKFEIQEAFNEVVKLVRKGYGIRKSIDMIGINEKYFYLRATDKMKAQLKLEKTAFAKLGARQEKGMPASSVLKRFHDDIVNLYANADSEDDEF
jgi:hypothetical protein